MWPCVGCRFGHTQVVHPSRSLEAGVEIVWKGIEVMTKSCWCVLMVSLMLVEGCAPDGTPETSSPGQIAPSTTGPVEIDPGPVPPGQSEPAIPNEPGVNDVTVEIRGWDQVFQDVNSHSGKVVVIDVWSTSCPPCIAEFPQLVKMHQELGEDVVCHSVSVDYEGIASKPLEEYQEKVLEFLKSQGATFQNTLCSDDFDTLADQGKLFSIPVVFVYDQAGKLAQKFDGPTPEGDEFTYEKQVRPFVESLLAK